MAATSPEVNVLFKTYQNLESKLQTSSLGRPILISSAESADSLRGDLHAVIDHPFASLRQTAINADRWCETILLLSNTKSCHVDSTQGIPKLAVLASSTKTQSAAGATSSDFQFLNQKDDPAYLNVALLAESGPMGTSQIRLQLQAMPLTSGRSFVHLHYSYNTNWVGRLAMQTYLQTLGRGKLGFSTVDALDGNPGPIGGARGVIERNTMRYFLGLECALATNAPASAARFQAMASCWYDAVEKYPVQLHEMQRTEYLTIKAAEYQNPKTGP